jgi:hypothetical protein
MRLIIVYLFGVINLIIAFAVMFSISKTFINVPTLWQRALLAIFTILPPLIFAARSLIWKYRQSKKLWIITFIAQTLNLVIQVLITFVSLGHIGTIPLTIVCFLNLLILLWHMPEAEDKQPQALSNSEGEKNQ